MEQWSRGSSLCRHSRQARAFECTEFEEVSPGDSCRFLLLLFFPRSNCDFFDPSHPGHTMAKRRFQWTVKLPTFNLSCLGIGIRSGASMPRRSNECTMKVCQRNERQRRPAQPRKQYSYSEMNRSFQVFFCFCLFVFVKWKRVLKPFKKQHVFIREVDSTSVELQCRKYGGVRKTLGEEW
jgi:hypothetical protein